MPCTYYTPEETSRQNYEESQRLKTELDKVTRLLCELMHEVEHEYHPNITLELEEWWADHKEKDKARLAAEEAAEEAALKLAKEMELAKEKKEKKEYERLKKKYDKK